MNIKCELCLIWQSFLFVINNLIDVIHMFIFFYSEIVGINDSRDKKTIRNQVFSHTVRHE